MIKIGICEDVEAELNEQKRLVEKIMQELSLNVEITCFKSGEDLLYEMETKGKLDIILMDIEMDGINGVETAQKIRETDYRVIIIYVSSHDKYYREIVMVHPFSFVDKPISESRLKDVLERASVIVGNDCDYFEFDHRKIHYKLFLTQIRYFESDKRVIYLYGVDERYSFYRKLDEVERELKQASTCFIRVHKSFLVNSNFIKEYRHDMIVMNDGKEIKISKAYKETVKNYYLEVVKKS